MEEKVGVSCAAPGALQESCRDTADIGERYANVHESREPIYCLEQKHDRSPESSTTAVYWALLLLVVVVVVEVVVAVVVAVVVVVVVVDLISSNFKVL